MQRWASVPRTGALSAKFSLKTRALRSLTACLVVRHWAWLCKPYFSWPIHVRKCPFWVRARYFPTFRNTLTTRCLQTCCEFINSISQIFYLALLLILAVLRSCHFFHASRSCVAVDSQQWQGNVLAPFFHPWHYTNTPTVTVIATWPSPKCKSVSCFLTCWFGILELVAMLGDIPVSHVPPEQIVLGVSCISSVSGIDRVRCVSDALSDCSDKGDPDTLTGSKSPGKVVPRCVTATSAVPQRCWLWLKNFPLVLFARTC